VSSVDTIVFDKTGTLTVGRPVVKSVICSSNSGDEAAPKWTERDLLTLAAGVERTASHPVARALVQAAANAGSRQAAVCAHYLDTGPKLPQELLCMHTWKKNWSKMK